MFNSAGTDMNILILKTIALSVLKNSDNPIAYVSKLLIINLTPR